MSARRVVDDLRRIELPGKKPHVEAKTTYPNRSMATKTCSYEVGSVPEAVALIRGIRGDE